MILQDNYAKEDFMHYFISWKEWLHNGALFIYRSILTSCLLVNQCEILITMVLRFPFYIIYFMGYVINTNLGLIYFITSYHNRKFLPNTAMNNMNKLSFCKFLYGRHKSWIWYGNYNPKLRYLFTSVRCSQKRLDYHKTSQIR